MQCVSPKCLPLLVLFALALAQAAWGIGTPLLTLPRDGSSGVALTITLGWRGVAGATGYEAQVALDNTFVTPTQDEAALTGTTLSLAGPAPLTKYFWRVRATDGANWGDWSPVYSFTTRPTIPPEAPTIISPADGVHRILAQ